MKKIDPFIAIPLAYVLGIFITYGHACAHYTKVNDCGQKHFCASPGERAFFSSMFWPFYVSMTAWSDEK